MHMSVYGCSPAIRITGMYMCVAIEFAREERARVHNFLCRVSHQLGRKLRTCAIDDLCFEFAWVEFFYIVVVAMTRKL